MTNSKGFTLVEIVIVIAIIGMLSIVAIPVYKSHLEKARIVQTNSAIEKNTVEKTSLEEAPGGDVADDNVFAENDDPIATSA
jgi:prepilin-type N-terminal cleavage/methylation domain-containing protein